MYRRRCQHVARDARICILQGVTSGDVSMIGARVRAANDRAQAEIQSGDSSTRLWHRTAAEPAACSAAGWRVESWAMFTTQAAPAMAAFEDLAPACEREYLGKGS
jgi:hypothetical protein